MVYNGKMLDLPAEQYKWIRELSFADVFEIWRSNEEGKERWESHAREHGFSGWEEWRMRYVKALGLQKRYWSLYQVIDPLAVVPRWHGGPFKTWMERHYGGIFMPTFAQLARRPDMQEHAGLKKMQGVFPRTTTVIALFRNNQLVVIEGMHRCVAIASAARAGRQIETDFFAALADASGEELKPVGQFRR